LSESTTQKIEELKRQLAALKQERDQLNNEARSWAEKRNAIHQQIKTLGAEAKSLKEKRDATNQKVQELKGLREQTRNEQKEKRAQISKTKERMRVLQEKKPHCALSDIQKAIEEFEWKIQTTPLSVKEEKVLVDQVRILENQRVTHKQLKELKDALVELQTEEKALATKAKLHHERLIELADQGQRCHEQMLGLLTKSQDLRAEADAAHQKYVELRQKSNEIHQSYVEFLQRVKLLEQEIQKRDAEKQAVRQQELCVEATKKAQEKMRRGEKLTWEEFKLLIEQGAV